MARREPDASAIRHAGLRSQTMDACPVRVSDANVRVLVRAGVHGEDLGPVIVPRWE